MTDSSNHLSMAMGVAVLLRTKEMEDRGGPSSEDMKRATAAGHLLGEHGDKLLFRSKKKGETAKVFNETAHAIAVLAFVPGGVTVFGQHFEAKRQVEESSNAEGSR